MRWYRSLYWRIAVGVVGFLAAMLVVQAMLFVWAVSQSGRSLPGQSPARLGATVALDLASVLERDPHADLARYVHDQYAQYTHPFFVMLARVAESIYWMSRYVERAENVARFIEVNLNLMLDLPVGSAQQWKPLVAPTAGVRIARKRSVAAAAIGSTACPAGCRSFAPRRSSSAAASPASSSCRRRRRSGSCSDGMRPCSPSSPGACSCSALL